VRIPLDILLVFSANPEDYTNRGSIITPLKDRISSQILTHYPSDPKVAAAITAQEAWLDREGVEEASLVVPESVRLLIEEISFVARESELVDQTSGVSARMPIAALELLYSNLERRALRTGEKTVYPRLCDLHMVLPAITGKVEMVYEGEQQGAEVVARKLIGEAVKKTFARKFPKVGRAAEATSANDEEQAGPYLGIVRFFAEGGQVLVSDEMPFEEYLKNLQQVPGLLELAEQFAGEPSMEARALTAEIILEGLHQHLKIAREDLDSRISYKELVKLQLLRPKRPRRGDRDERDVN